MAMACPPSTTCSLHQQAPAAPSSRACPMRAYQARPGSRESHMAILLRTSQRAVPLQQQSSTRSQLLAHQLCYDQPSNAPPPVPRPAHGHLSCTPCLPTDTRRPYHAAPDAASLPPCTARQAPSPHTPSSPMPSSSSPMRLWLQVRARHAPEQEQRSYVTTHASFV